MFILPPRHLVKVKLIVLDVNDNKPTFSTDVIWLFVPENAWITSRFAVEQSAIDSDSGVYGVQTYRPVNNFGVFTLDVEENNSGESVLVLTGSTERN
uniref:Cadherin domain-containing protein n=1 Tax=Anguilla anguilla TaxID=7936 RepID=A0A0E9V2Q5_ANGAN